MRSRTSFILAFLNCLQLGIIAALCISGNTREGRFGDSPHIAVDSQANPAGKPKTDTSVGSLQLAPFRWATLESSDYRRYVENLRSIQCPEQTIRDIITADIDANVYLVRRQKLQARERESASDAGSLREAEQELWKEEFGVIARILGGENPDTSGNSDFAPKRADLNPATMPLVLAVSSSDVPEFNDYQRAALDRLRQTFIKGLSGLNSSSPGYDKEWRKTQPEVDAYLEAALGAQVYQDLKLQALRHQVSASKGQN